MYSESRNITYELKKCVLKNLETGEELLAFDARSLSEPTSNASFVGSGLASGGRKWSIATPTIFNYEPFNHAVVYNGIQYIVLSKRPITHIKFGESFSSRNKSEIAIELE